MYNLQYMAYLLEKSLRVGWLDEEFVLL